MWSRKQAARLNLDTNAVLMHKILNIHAHTDRLLHDKLKGTISKQSEPCTTDRYSYNV